MEKIILKIKKHYKLSYRDLAALLGITERVIYNARNGTAGDLINRYLKLVHDNIVLTKENIKLKRKP